jgi:nucleoside-diphosphate-sugar epimerase
MIKMIVTGANGFIGRALVNKLKNENTKIVVLVRSNEQAEFFKQHHIEYIIGDITDRKSLLNLPDADILFHLAGVLDHTKGQNYLTEVNVKGTENILEICKIKNINRLVYLSTLAVVANGNELNNIDETYPLPAENIGIYAESKAKAEKLLLDYPNHKPEIIIVRSPFVWGNGDNFSIPMIIENINKGIFSWIENGEYLFATCHVENLAEGLYLAGIHGKNKNIYFIQDSETTTLREFLSAILKSQNIKVPTKNTSLKMIKFICNVIELPWRILPLKSKAPTHLRETIALMGLPVTINSNKAKNEIKYYPVVSRIDGIEKLKLTQKKE